MRPDDPQYKRSTTPLIPQRPVLSTPPAHDRQHNTHVAAANVARTQLNHIYSGHTDTPTPQTTPVASQQNQPAEHNTFTATETTEQQTPYERTHAHTSTTVQSDQWKQYHSAWQEYYQKYYERYYVSQMQHSQKALEERIAAAKAQPSDQSAPEQTAAPESQPLTRDEALYDLRSQLIAKVRYPVFHGCHLRRIIWCRVPDDRNIDINLWDKELRIGTHRNVG